MEGYGGRFCELNFKIEKFEHKCLMPDFVHFQLEKKGASVQKGILRN